MRNWRILRRENHDEITPMNDAISNPFSTSPSIAPAALIVIGVAGCGKSSIGAAVAQGLGWRFIEGDGNRSVRSDPGFVAMREAVLGTIRHEADTEFRLGTST